MCRKRIKIITLFTLILLVVFSILFTLKFKIVVVSGNSMEPTLYNKQILIAKKQFDDIKYSDIIVLKVEDYGIIIKRVVGMSGDKITSENGLLKINNLVYSNYHYHFENTIILDKNELFIIGDNYGSSIDSRDFGSVKKENIIAKVQN